jgi:hypothetical protein
VFTRRPPFHGVPDFAVQFWIYKGASPERPADSQCHGYSVPDKLWDIVSKTLNRDAFARANISTVVANLEALYPSFTPPWQLFVKGRVESASPLESSMDLLLPNLALKV